MVFNVAPSANGVQITVFGKWAYITVLWGPMGARDAHMAHWGPQGPWGPWAREAQADGRRADGGGRRRTDGERTVARGREAGGSTGTHYVGPIVFEILAQN